jgi:exopolyphosphatase/guanosine-5'-triphosphate,3'-diphosphate pyrophosphatase
MKREGTASGTHAMTPERSSDILASIDVGSHTARLLVARWEAGRLESLLRKRAYIRLAEDFESPESRTLKQAGIERALKSLEEFKSDLEEYRAKTTRAVATGVVRAAANRDPFMDLIREKTGIQVEVISGEEEARLTGLGIQHALELGGRPFIAFDLGGGTTEFLLVLKRGKSKALTLPLGAMILTQRHFVSDPPQEKEIESLKEETRGLLLKAFPDEIRDYPLVGTGGTVTTLAAMVHGIEVQGISPERMNGLFLDVHQLEELLYRMKHLSVAERVALPGLDQGRADVILAGSLVVKEILFFFRSSEMMISLTDLLEGALLDVLGVSFGP